MESRPRRRDGWLSARQRDIQLHSSSSLIQLGHQTWQSHGAMGNDRHDRVAGQAALRKTDLAYANRFVD